MAVSQALSDAMAKCASVEIKKPYGHKKMYALTHPDGVRVCLGKSKQECARHFLSSGGYVLLPNGDTQ